MQGIQEAHKAGVGAKGCGDSGVGCATRLVETLLEAIATNRPCAYGPAEVAEAVEAGAGETLLVSDAGVREGGIEELMGSAHVARGNGVPGGRPDVARPKDGALRGGAPPP